MARKRTSALIFRTAIAVACTALGGAWFLVSGPFPVIRFTTPLPILCPSWYMLSAFPILGFLVADLVLLYRYHGLSIRVLELTLQIGLLVALGHVRLIHRIPVSGHTLLFSYFILRRLALGSPEGAATPVELGVAAAALLATSYAKIFWWDDPFTIVSGILLGTALAAISWLSVTSAIAHKARA